MKLNALQRPKQSGHFSINHGYAIEGLAMVDSGSNQSLIRKKFADKLGLAGETKKMKMYVADGGIRVEDWEEFYLKISPCYVIVPIILASFRL
jgi:hypothetical protein